MVHFVYGEFHYFEGNYTEPIKNKQKRMKLSP